MDVAPEFLEPTLTFFDQHLEVKERASVGGEGLELRATDGEQLMKTRWPVIILALFWLAIAAWVLNAESPVFTLLYGSSPPREIPW